MHRQTIRLILFTALVSGGLYAQDVRTLFQEAKQSYNEISANILKSAEWMPENTYNFRPTPNSRSFGELIEEITRSQSSACAAIQGKSWPGNGLYAPSKAYLLENLKRSIAGCDSAYSSVTSANANDRVQFGNGSYSKLGLLFLNASHDNELYGQIAVYLRLKGIVPPSSRARIVPLD